MTSPANDEAALAEFVIKVAHDVRTPLTAIRGYTDILLHRGDQRTADSREDLLKRTMASAVRMEEQVTEMALRANRMVDE